MYVVDPEPDWLIDDLLERGAVPLGPLTDAGRWRQWWRAQQRARGGTELGRLAAGQGFVLSTGQAHRLGLRASDIRREVRRRTLWSPAHGVLSPVLVDGDDHLASRRRHALRTAAAVLQRPDHVAAARSAAVLYGLPTLAIPPRPEVITRAADTTGRRRDMLVRGGPIAAAQVTTWFGTPVVAPARAVVDAARFDRRDGVMTADAALRDGLCTAAQLDAAIASVRTFPGVRRAAEVVPLASALAESPLESLVRLALVDDAFPSFELQVEISTRGTTYRVDALFRRQGLVLEMDGLGKYTVEELRREKMREARLRAAGYRVERVTWEDVMRFWPQTRARLWAALAP